MDASDPVPEGVSAFIEKVWRMTNDPWTDNLIQWSKDGQSIVIHDSTQFARTLLPRYYKHNNLASFVRQLNKYGFRKITPLEQQPSVEPPLEFAHNDFVRGKPEQLINIRRKPTVKEIKEADVGLISNSDSQTQDMSVSNEILRLVTSQELVDLDISSLKQEVSFLKRKVSAYRGKQKKLKRVLFGVLEVVKSLAGNGRNGYPGNNLLKRLPSIEDIGTSSDESYDSSTEASPDFEPVGAKNHVRLDNDLEEEDVFVLDSDSDDGYNISEEERRQAFMKLNSPITSGVKRKETDFNESERKSTVKSTKTTGNIMLHGNISEASAIRTKSVVMKEVSGLKKSLPNQRLIVSPSAIVKMTERGKNNPKVTVQGGSSKGPSRFVLVANEYRPGNITSEFVLSHGLNTSGS